MIMSYDNDSHDNGIEIKLAIFRCFNSRAAVLARNDRFFGKKNTIFVFYYP